MLKPHKLCKVCIECQKNPKLLKDIYNTSAFLKTGIPLLTLYNEYTQVHGQKFAYSALRGHTKKHQFMSEKDYTNRHLRKLATDAEKSILRKKIESTEVWDKVIDEGMDRLESGELQMKTSDLLKAAKDKSDFELKTKDQQLQMAMMVAYFASGENNESQRYDRRIVEGAQVQTNNPAGEFAEDLDGGEDRSSSVYYPPSWDAST